MLTALLGVCAVVVIAGCGGGGASEEVSSPLDNALGYLPEDAPFVVAADTDPDGEQIQAAQAILERFPFAGQVTGQLEAALADQDIDYERDVKPLLGNEVVIGGTDAATFVADGGDDEEFVGAVEAKDADKLTELLERDGTKQSGEQSGATIYEDDDGGVSAIEGDTFVVAGTRKLLEAALKQREADDRLTEDAFAQNTEGMPEEAGLRGSFDVGGLLEADPDTADARKVKWLSALRQTGFAVSFADDSVTLDFRVATDDDELEEADLPFAAGEESPSVLDTPGEIGAGLRDLTQIVRFGEATGQTIDPQGYGQYNSGKQTLEQRLDIDIQRDLLDQLAGDLALSVAIGGDYSVRTELEDPDAFEATLKKLEPVLPGIVESAVGGPVELSGPSAGGLYELQTPDGPVGFGVSDGLFVLGNGGRATGLASSEPVAVEGAEGAVSLRADAEQVATQILGQLGGLVPGGAIGAGFVVGPLDELSGSMRAETDGISGTLRLTLDE